MANDILIYQTEDNEVAVRLDGAHETLWLSQKQMAELFDKDVRTINEHLKNVYKAQELDSQSTIRKFQIVQTEGQRDVTRNIEHYNLDAILSVSRSHAPRGNAYGTSSKRGCRLRCAARGMGSHAERGNQN